MVVKSQGRQGPFGRNHAVGAAAGRMRSHDNLISRVTDAVLEEVREWQIRPLDPVYPVIFFDALRVNIRDEGLARRHSRSVQHGRNHRLSFDHGNRRVRRLH